jgi:hypothetical protein
MDNATRSAHFLPYDPLAPLDKASAVGELGLLVAPSKVHPVAPALRELDNQLPERQRAGDLPTDSMTQLRRSLAPRPRSCSDSHGSPDSPRRAGRRGGEGRMSSTRARTECGSCCCPRRRAIALSDLCSLSWLTRCSIVLSRRPKGLRQTSGRESGTALMDCGESSRRVESVALFVSEQEERGRSLVLHGNKRRRPLWNARSVAETCTPE